MALNIGNAETEQLAERIAELTGETKTAAVTRALRERLGEKRFQAQLILKRELTLSHILSRDPFPFR
jgi:hypothetical protein